jgi:hypothetical protein
MDSRNDVRNGAIIRYAAIEISKSGGKSLLLLYPVSSRVSKK